MSTEERREDIEDYYKKYRHELYEYEEAYYFLMGVLIGKGWPWSIAHNAVLEDLKKLWT